MVCVSLYTAVMMIACVGSILLASATGVVSGWGTSLGLVDCTPCRCWLVWPMKVLLLLGKCLETLC